MKQLFENWRKHLNEIGPSPSFQKTLDRSRRGWQKSMDDAAAKGREAGELEDEEFRITEPMPEEDEMRDLANQIGAEIEFRTTTEGEHIALVTFEDGEQVGYRDEEEMYQDLRKKDLY